MVLVVMDAILLRTCIPSALFTSQTRCQAELTAVGFSAAGHAGFHVVMSMPVCVNFQKRDGLDIGDRWPGEYGAINSIKAGRGTERVMEMVLI